jgi:hypothetical protein
MAQYAVQQIQPCADKSSSDSLKPHTMLAIPRSDCGEDWPPGRFRRGSASTLGMSATEPNNILRALQDPQERSPPWQSHRHHTLDPGTGIDPWCSKHETYHLLYYISSISIKTTIFQQHFPIPLIPQAHASAELRSRCPGSTLSASSNR